MSFRFTGMVGADAALNVIQSGGDVVVETADGKPCLEVERSGQVTRDLILIETLVRRYVAFSGRNFPHILVLLMEQKTRLEMDSRNLRV